MNERIVRALEKWPNVPDLYGWLGLDQRGRWSIRGELISNPQIIDTINRQYAADERGCWYFQNGPQRGFVTLEYAPLVLRTDHDGALHTHTGQHVSAARAAFLDEDGHLLLQTEHGPGVLDAHGLDWALHRLRVDQRPVTEDELADALALPSGTASRLQLQTDGASLPVMRVDADDMPTTLGFVRDPKPDTPPRV